MEEYFIWSSITVLDISLRFSNNSEAFKIFKKCLLCTDSSEHMAVDVLIIVTLLDY